MIQQLIGIDSDYIVIGLAGLSVILLALYIVNIIQMLKLKKNYKIFMTGKKARNLEETLIRRLDQIDLLMESNGANEREIKTINKKLRSTFCKMGIVKYDAFQEMGGKLSFSLALLDEKEDGFIINAVHSREVCYTYIKDVIGGNAVIPLSEEENEALDIALKSETRKKADA